MRLWHLARIQWEISLKTWGHSYNLDSFSTAMIFCCHLDMRVEMSCARFHWVWMRIVEVLACRVNETLTFGLWVVRNISKILVSIVWPWFFFYGNELLLPFRYARWDAIVEVPLVLDENCRRFGLPCKWYFGILLLFSGKYLSKREVSRLTLILFLWQWAPAAI